MMNDPKGSLWHKWDLHVHTPASLRQEYGGNAEPIWENYLADLEKLPPEFKVLGINDYIFIDGYKRLLAEKLKGRLANIELLLPVIELRIDKFVGTDGHWGRINYHVIFSDEINPEIIQSQFINALYTKYKINPEYEGIGKKWAAVPTKESLEDLGKLIIESVPLERRNQFSTPLIEGFNNLNVSLENVLSILENPYFQGKYLLSVGKTEWASLQWNDHSIADKKNIINKAQFVFTSAETVEDCKKSRRQLSSSNVNSRLLDCSDAHRFSSATNKDRVGKCFTWIKADISFAGLFQAYLEYDQRVYLGDVPPKLELVDINKTKYLKSIHIDKHSGSSLNEVWFDNINIEFNQDLVAIIGNKGAGKSALADIVGLLGNTRNYDSFSFLNSQRFCIPSRNLGDHFSAELEWCSSARNAKALSASTDKNQSELVKYIPQGLFDKICNEIPGGEETDFDKELKKVIFSHVDIPDRLGQDTLDELIDYKTNEIQDSIRLLKTQLAEVNIKIKSQEDFLKPAYKTQVDNWIKQKEDELRSHDESKPTEELQPQETENLEIKKMLSRLAALKKNKQEYQEKIANIKKEDAELSLMDSIVSKVIGQIDNLISYYQNFQEEVNIELQKIDLSINDLVSLSYNREPLLAKSKEFTSRRGALKVQLDTENKKSLTNKMAQVESEIEEIQDRLDEPNRKHQSYLERLDYWTNKRQVILGDRDSLESLNYYRWLQDEIVVAPEKLDELRRGRTKIVKQIFSKIQALVTIYSKLYKPVQDFIETYSMARDKFKLRFDVSVVNIDFQDRFFDWIGKNRIGSFYGGETGEKTLNQILQKHNFNTEDGVINFLDEIYDHLSHDHREGAGTSTEIETQLKKGQSLVSFYDFLYSLDYLAPRYVLKLSEKDLNQLSPGERGSVLLIFYLLIDKDLIPLVIDQPEGNLDNQTVYQLLVDAIKEAKKNRQIIIVTHNPNLAVVCDAEQIICCEINKDVGNQITYTSGAIENPVIKKHIIDILEGTKPAFDNRKFKYDPQVTIQ